MEQIAGILVALLDGEVTFTDKYGRSWDVGTFRHADGKRRFWLSQHGKTTRIHETKGFTEALVRLLA